MATEKWNEEKREEYKPRVTFGADRTVIVPEQTWRAIAYCVGVTQQRAHVEGTSARTHDWIMEQVEAFNSALDLPARDASTLAHCARCQRAEAADTLLRTQELATEAHGA